MPARPTERRFTARFLQRKNWWIAWTDDVPGALSQGKTLDEARENLKDAIRLMREPVDEAAMPEHTEHLIEEVIVL